MAKRRKRSGGRKRSGKNPTRGPKGGRRRMEKDIPSGGPARGAAVTVGIIFAVIILVLATGALTNWFSDLGGGDDDGGSVVDGGDGGDGGDGSGGGSGGDGTDGTDGGDGGATLARVVLIEDITATWCPPCKDMAAALDLIFEEYGKDSVAVVAYHTGEANGDPFTNVKVDDRVREYPGESIPNVWVDGVENIVGAATAEQAYEDVKAEIEKRAAVETGITIDAEVDIIEGLATITATFELDGDVEYDELQALFVMYENGLEHDGETYDHVVRDVERRPVWPDQFPSEVTVEFQFADEWKESKIHGVVIAQVDEKADEGEEVIAAANAIKV